MFVYVRRAYVHFQFILFTITQSSNNILEAHMISHRETMILRCAHIRLILLLIASPKNYHFYLLLYECNQVIGKNICLY